MIYGYIRVSTDKQAVETQRFEITKFSKSENWIVNGWAEEVVSGMKKVKDRALGGLLDKLEKGDTLVVAELSRLGRKSSDLFNVLDYCKERGICLYSVKERFCSNSEDICSLAMIHAFAMCAALERALISQRTKEGLARLKANGVKLGRAIGGLNKVYRLDEMKNDFIFAWENGTSKDIMARNFGVCRKTLYTHMKRLQDSGEWKIE